LIGLLVLAIIVASVVLTVGAGFIALFGDVIICVLVIALLVKLFKRKK
jgi:hypothetical protein